MYGRVQKCLSAFIVFLLPSLVLPSLNSDLIAQDLDWQQWRGPHRDGKLSDADPWPDSLSDKNFKLQWKKELGPSYSGPIVSKELVFTTETRNETDEVVRAFDRQSGEQKWEKSWKGSMEVPFFAKSNGDWIRSTPAFDGNHLYVAGMRDVLVCLDAETGEEIWQVNFVERHGSALPAFGFVCSPLVTDEHVYVQAGAGVCKLNKKNGEEIWRALADGGGMYGSAFSSPTIATLAGKEQLLVQTRESLAGVDLETGSVLWSRKIPTFRGMNILTPTVSEDSVFTSAYGGQTWLFDVSASGETMEIKEKWKNRAQGYMSSPIVINNHVYLHLRNQRFTCIDLATGESKWTTKPYGKYWSLVANGDKILALDERGDLLLIKANPEKFDLIGTTKVSSESTWAHLAVSGDEILIRELNSLKAYVWKSGE